MNVVCFDLDDTLFKEIDYLRAAYRYIAHMLWGDDWEKCYDQMMKWYEAGENVFSRICEMREDVELGGLLNIYRYQMLPLILSIDVEDCLKALKGQGVKLGIITDGRALTQENKIKSLGLYQYFDEDMIVISETFGYEKPSLANYEYFMKKHPECSDFTYIGDNPQKDFYAPNLLGWNTICLLDDGRNIHKQDFEKFGVIYQPKVKIHKISECINRN